MKAVGYIRVSTGGGGQKESPENQRQLIANYLMEQGYDLVEFYIDVKSQRRLQDLVEQVILQT
jgi:DNA invertase Pin-like site-specific DNA recombinase